jgi:L-rhamnose-H+ transport protein
MPLLTGFLLVLIAGVLQGSFVLPMTLVRRWSWEHTWATFSLLGMFVFNWLITVFFIPNILSVYSASPQRDLAILALVGAGWGLGAVFFGLGMDRLGMALGYPIIMGLIASLGALLPLLVFFPQTLLSSKGAYLIGGTLLVIFGIVLCSRAGSRRQSQASHSTATQSQGIRSGLVIAVSAGVLSCLPNVGAAFATRVAHAAQQNGVSPAWAGNAAWALLFTAGCLVNLGYCLYLMISRKSLPQYWRGDLARNTGLSTLMAAMWIGSFYLYGAGATKLGRLGLVVGWPLFISLSILVGNLWGLSRGEWRGTPLAARRLLSAGMSLLIVAVVVVAISSSV